MSTGSGVQQQECNRYMFLSLLSRIESQIKWRIGIREIKLKEALVPDEVFTAKRISGCSASYILLTAFLTLVFVSKNNGKDQLVSY